MRIKHFNRYELKYILSRQQAQYIAEDLMNYVQPDSNSDEEGTYGVSSLYYDTRDYKAYWDKLEGHRFRRKLRIRVYTHQPILSETNCYVEIKQRNNRALQKKRIYIPYEVATTLCSFNGGDVNSSTNLSETDQAVKQEIRYLVETLRLQPACIVSYNRQAFNGGVYDPGLRVTFDTNLRCRIHALSLSNQTKAENHFFLPPDWSIMEIKINQRVPYWLSERLSHHRCTLRRISKYCTALETAKFALQQRQISS